MYTVGVRELKNRLTHYLAMVRAGEKVVVTQRGNPIAIVHGLSDTGVSTSLEERLAVLAKQGMLRLPLSSRRLKFKPLPLRGKPVSRIVSEDRR